MKRTNSEQIGDILKQYLRDEGIETPLNQYRLIQSWKEVMGAGIEKFTGEMFIKNQTLYVKIKSSVLKNDLSMSRSNIVNRLNNQVGAQVITDIKFY